MHLHSADDRSVSQQLMRSSQLRRQHASDFCSCEFRLVHVGEDTLRGGFWERTRQTAGSRTNRSPRLRFVNVSSPPIRQPRTYGMLAIASFE
jgi:hypothetical protein